MTSPSDPAIIIAGIRQFGLAPDGADLRDLEAAIARLRSSPDNGLPTDAANLLMTIESALADCDGEELVNGDVLDFPEAYEALDKLRASASSPGRDVAAEVISQCAACVPTTWLDPLLTGPNAVWSPDGEGLERVLRAIAERIRSVPSGQGPSK